MTKESKEPKYTDMYLRGMMCRIFQHEIDHLDGILVWNRELKDVKQTSELADEK